MTFDFDLPIERRGTGAVKWDRYKGRDVLPMWVADMDFRAPPAVIEALHRRVAHGVFGYTNPPEELLPALIAALDRDYGWRVEPSWFLWLPGVVVGLNAACRAVGTEGDDVVTLVPVYPPFLSAPGLSQRGLLTVPLCLEGARWTIDFDRFEAGLTPRTKLFLLCNPHNPVGRCLARQELTRLADICLRHDVAICSDEIHCGLVLDADKRHIPTATLGPEVARRTITLMAPSKTYNLPGLGFSFAVIPDKDLRRQFLEATQGIVPHVNAFAYLAALAAYRDSADWHAALIEYLRENAMIVEREVASIPGLAVTHVEATYLAWIDCPAAGIEQPARFFEKAGVGLSDGADFHGEGFVRLNFGCPRAMLGEALRRLRKAVEERR